jgi:hypothetical protein
VSAKDDTPAWVRDLDKPFRPVADIIAEAERDAAAETKAAGTGQGRNRASGPYRNRAMTTNPGREG